MRILKYVILLLILGFIAISVFIATQKGNYEVKRTIFIKSPPATVYNYISDYKNYDQWGFWKEELPGAKFTSSPNSSGVGSSYQWKSVNNDNGEISTTFLVENDSIAQKFTINENPGTYNWKLIDSANGTKVIWYAKGKLRFMSKIKSVFNGGIDAVMGNNFEKSLANLDTNLDYEINTFTATLNGKVERPAVNYLKQTINSKIANHPRNLAIMLRTMRNFFDKNKIPTAGKPFVIYHTYNTVSGITKFSVCMPIASEVHIGEGSDIQFEKSTPYTAIKSTLKGDYSHLQKAREKSIEFIAENNLSRIAPFSIEQYTVGVETSKQPSKWITEIFIPVQTHAVRDTTAIERRGATPRRITLPPSNSPQLEVTD